MNEQRIKAKAELGHWFRKAIISELLDYYKLFIRLGLTKKAAYESAKECVNAVVNDQIKRNFEGPKHLLKKCESDCFSEHRKM